METVMRFVERLGEVYRVLLETESGSWLISCADPGPPFYVSADNLPQFQRVQAPEDFLRQSRKELTAAQKKRLALIQPLLDDTACITDRTVRMASAKELASEHGTTARRILRLYYRYLATGMLTAPKAGHSMERNAVFEWAIRTWYYSARRMSLRAAYDMMLVQKFTDSDGVLAEDHPSWGSFRHYFYSHCFHKNPQKAISREGLTNYQRNLRPAFGSASGWRPKPGAYQMDATQADIYLVSRLDRSVVVGRPYIYMAVDTATQLIAGIYVGFDCDESAVMACLAQAAGDKEEYCREYGIDIQPEQWPSRGMPAEIITDKGREFFSTRMGELCRRYGIEAQSLPPFRPDGKGLVEKAFDLLQQRYKPLLRGKGVIEADAQERWAVDYRTQAALDLDEFTQVIIHAVIYLNSGRLLPSGKTPARTWLDAVPQLLEVPEEELRLQTLPREDAKLTRKGFHLNHLWYAPTEMEGLFLNDTYTLAYDPADISEVHIVLPDGFQPCPLTKGCASYGRISSAESEAIRGNQQATKHAARANEVQSSAASVQAIREVAAKAVERKEPLECIKENQNRERRLLR